MFHSTYFASRASAKTPAASGAAAEVPECVLVHLPYRSVVACKRMSYATIIQQAQIPYHSGVWILGAVAEGRSQRTGAGLIVVCILSVVDRRVDGDGPHAGRVAVTITVVVLAAVTRSPNVDVAQTSSTLEIKVVGQSKQASADVRLSFSSTTTTPLTSLTPLTMALMVAFLGPSTVLPSSVGPQLAL